jgi:hypothetical protein
MSEYGTLGAHNRVKIPDCVVSFVRSIHPNSDGLYMGFQAYGEDGGAQVGADGDNDLDSHAHVANNITNQNENVNKVKDMDDVEDEGIGDADAMEESFEEAENIANPPNSINFSSGERIKLGMHFNFSFFNIDHVCCFVMQSPVDGCEIACHEKLNTAWITCADKIMYQRAFTYCFSSIDLYTQFTITKV